MFFLKYWQQACTFISSILCLQCTELSLWEVSHSHQPSKQRTQFIITHVILYYNIYIITYLTCWIWEVTLRKCQQHFQSHTDLVIWPPFQMTPQLASITCARLLWPLQMSLLKMLAQYRIQVTVLGPPSFLLSPANLACMRPTCPSKPLLKEVNRTEPRASWTVSQRLSGINGIY